MGTVPKKQGQATFLRKVACPYYRYLHPIGGLMNKLRLIFVLPLCLVTCLVSEEAKSIDDNFIDATMRVDFFHIGDAEKEWITIDHIYQQGIWAGSKKNLIDPFNSGRYCVKVNDAESGKLLYSKGYDSYFGEYKTTDKALEGIQRTYHESALIPYPKNKILFALEVRDKQNNLKPLFSQEIDPSSVDIIREKPARGIKVITAHESGDPHEKVDIVFIAEGYTADEEEKFKTDLDRMKKIFFSQEPYKSRSDSFNLYGVFKPSDDSGCDEPRHGKFMNTAVSATFNSLGSERYLMTEDNKALRDVAAHVPYDTLLIMVNHKRYGGGGIYNLFCTFTADNQWHQYLFLHEFGHSFAGLADEYYTSAVAYNEFYPIGIEPVEPNITALLDPNKLKWADTASEGISIPTPWEKEEYDRMNLAYQKIRQEVNDKLARLKREGASDAEIHKAEQEVENLSRDHAAKMDAYLEKSKFKDMVGAFEGAGYSSKGLYRPMLDCLMFSKGNKPFCAVCEQAVIRVIEHYTH